MNSIFNYQVPNQRPTSEMSTHITTPPRYTGAINPNPAINQEAFSFVLNVIAMLIEQMRGSQGGSEVTTQALGEEDGGQVTTFALGEEDGGNLDVSTRAAGEEDGGQATTLALGEEDGGQATTLALGEEDGHC